MPKSFSRKSILLIISSSIVLVTLLQNISSILAEDTSIPTLHKIAEKFQKFYQEKHISAVISAGPWKTYQRKWNKTTSSLYIVVGDKLSSDNAKDQRATQSYSILTARRNSKSFTYEVKNGYGEVIDSVTYDAILEEESSSSGVVWLTVIACSSLLVGCAIYTYMSFNIRKPKPKRVYPDEEHDPINIATTSKIENTDTNDSKDNNKYNKDV